MNIPLTYRAAIRVLLHRVDAHIDITHRVMTGSIDTGDVSNVGTGALGSDAVVSTMTLVLDGTQPFLSPGAISPLNEPRPLLRPYRKVTVLAGEPGQQTTELFVGYLGDSVLVEGSGKKRRVTVTARDIAKPYQDLYLRSFPVLGGVNASIPSVLQQLIDLAPSDFRPDLIVPVPPDLLLSSAYQPEETTVWDAMQQLVTSMGWYLGARGNTLVLLEPPRGDDVPDVPLDADDFYEDAWTVSDTDLRNRITIEYGPAGQSVTLSDQASIDDITDGLPKHSFIRYDAESPIQTQQAATDVATAFLHDMSRPHAITRLTLPFLPSVRVFTILGVRHPIASGDTRLVAVASVRHEFGRDAKYRTTVLGSERVLGAHENWLARENKPGEVLALEV